MYLKFKYIELIEDNDNNNFDGALNMSIIKKNNDQDLILRHLKILKAKVHNNKS